MSSPVHPDYNCRIAVHQGQSILYNTEANILQIYKYTKQAKEDNADIILFNELFLHGYELKNDHFLEKLKDTSCEFDSKEIKQISSIAISLGIAICFGYAEKKTSAGIYNSCAVIDHKGNLILNYRKTHLWWKDEKKAFNCGDELKVAALSLASASSIIVSCLICYDVEFSECVRSVALQGCQLLLVPTALCIDLTTPLISLRARANDNHIFIAYSNHVNRAIISSREGTSTPLISDNDFVGLSAIIAPDGGEIARAPSSSSLTNSAKITNVTMSIDDEAALHTNRRIITIDENNTLLIANINTEMYKNAFTYIDFLHDRRSELYGNLT
mmetsp:Transcript_10260/g.9931  ORF Transcript_10260/g.9931 Transcript_10260/m.9931 type:complete len:329 (-) Transcript_10260:148-1134(-)